MAGTTNLNEQELESLRKGVVGAGLLVSVSDRGFIDTFKEAGALAKHVANARQTTESELVRQVAEVRGAGLGLTSSPEEVDAYRDFVIEVAESVASAAEGGDPAESGVLEKIKSALKEPSST
jgi:hypothetical protein